MRLATLSVLFLMTVAVVCGLLMPRAWKVERSIVVYAPQERVFRFWRNFANLPRFMKHLEEVRVLDDRRSHWVARSVGGVRVEWDAEIHNYIPNELIAWRSLEGADIPNAGSVRFERATGGRGTVVKGLHEWRRGLRCLEQVLV